MTIAISLKVNDGVVLASDSASTLTLHKADGQSSSIVYNNANKICNLRKGLPIGLITWGAGGIGQASLATLAKDFRKLLTDDEEWRICEDDYTIGDVAQKFKEFIFDHKYNEVYGKSDKANRPNLGSMIVGYSAGKTFAEEYRIDISKGECEGPALQRTPEQMGMGWGGQGEAIQRLYLGFPSAFPQIMKEVGIDQDKIEAVKHQAMKKLPAPLLMPPMPIQDAIDLARFLVETTENFSRFTLGPVSVGGPIEIAVITKHEGFKWVERKHYYNAEFNPSNT